MRVALHHPVRLHECQAAQLHPAGRHARPRYVILLLSFKCCTPHLLKLKANQCNHI